MTEKTYRIHSDGSFLPCETDAAGVVTVPTAGPLELVGGEYDFYAYAPALEMTARPTHLCRSALHPQGGSTALYRAGLFLCGGYENEAWEGYE